MSTAEENMIKYLSDHNKKVFLYDFQYRGKQTFSDSFSLEFMKNSTLPLKCKLLNNITFRFQNIDPCRVFLQWEILNVS